ncbi:PBECR2 nuclease fold domain-containing protein [Methylophaga nitratireducenticrescens]|uniref:PBECR2 nuclease fold domain-containing protein n=1 Tax=Methylophaga nitratireducenticrescens TaxID=754476 RepID=UPI000CDCD83A|nr:PBECR2 nuclease fold domain-containing protein [Methylophaga nitratireducenticrescens]AUZ85858.1 hypothetical protein CDW43_15355 [Methylophaga nitratireducenticrescens]
MPIKYGSMPFNKAVDAFRDKLNIPTATWTDIYQQQHARAFVIAGAMQEDILNDFRKSVDKVVADGISLQDFRKDFDSVVAKHGWGYNGGRNWRSRVIYETNLYQSHNSGRYQQMQQVKQTRPYWQYRHNDSVEHPRQEHLAWDGLILSADDSFWDTHYPANGWGCKCSVRTLNDRDLKRLGKTKPDQAPSIELEEKTVGINGPSPRTVKVPKGVDAGFAYNPGKAVWGETLSDDAMSQWKQSRSQWQSLTPSGWAETGRPDALPMVKAPVKLIERLQDKQAVNDYLTKQHGEQKLYKPGGIPLLLNAKTLSEHIDVRRSEYLPLLDDLFSNPYEVWLNFEQHKGTGKVVLRSRLVKGYDIGKGRYLLAVANTRKGYLESWTFLPTSDKKYIQRQRQGWLIHGDK